MKKTSTVIIILSIIIAIISMCVSASDIQYQNQTIAIGRSHSLVIKNDNTLWAWGDNTAGQLGNGAELERVEWIWSGNNEVKPIKILDNVLSVSGGQNHTLIVKNDNTLWACGDNWYGTLGNGKNSVFHNSSLIKIMDNVITSSAGGNHSMAIKNDNTLWTWGLNNKGQIGNGTIDDIINPIKIMDDVIQISAGTLHSMAIKKDGSLWAWGNNEFGQLGDGTTKDRLKPVKIIDNVLQVSTGNNHTCVIKTDNTLWIWGHNNVGQLGDGTVKNRLTPIKIIDDVIKVSVGDSYTMAIKKDGSLWAWGNNEFGQLGDGTKSYKNIPIKIMNDVIDVSANYYHTLILKKDGTIWTFGFNGGGWLGNGTYDESLIPYKVMDNIMLPDKSNSTSNTTNKLIPTDKLKNLVGTNLITSDVNIKTNPAYFSDNNIYHTSKYEKSMIKSTGGHFTDDIKKTKYHEKCTIDSNGDCRRLIGQCTWYVCGRLLDVYGIKLDSMADAKNWGTTFGNKKVKDINGNEKTLEWNKDINTIDEIKKLQAGSIIYYYGRRNNKDVQHVLFVEGIIGDNIYYSEANYGSVSNQFDENDGKLSVSNITSFYNTRLKDLSWACLYVK